MNVVDSSGWLEYFADGPNATFFASPISKVNELLVPTLSLYEVFKRVCQQQGESAGLQAISVMQEGQIVQLDTTIALAAAKFSIDAKLPMADSVMYVTARSMGASFWTQDADFKSFPDVKYIAKTS